MLAAPLTKLGLVLRFSVLIHRTGTAAVTFFRVRAREPSKSCTKVIKNEVLPTRSYRWLLDIVFCFLFYSADVLRHSSHPASWALPYPCLCSLGKGSWFVIFFCLLVLTNLPVLYGRYSLCVCEISEWMLLVMYLLSWMNSPFIFLNYHHAPSEEQVIFLYYFCD